MNVYLGVFACRVRYLPFPLYLSIGGRDFIKDFKFSLKILNGDIQNNLTGITNYYTSQEVIG